MSALNLTQYLNIAEVFVNPDISQLEKFGVESWEQLSKARYAVDVLNVGASVALISMFEHPKNQESLVNVRFPQLLISIIVL